MADVNIAVDVDKMSAADELQFQDLPHSDGSDQGAHGSGSSGRVQTHTFTHFPNQNDSDEDEDKADLLKGEKKSSSFWTFEYYQTFFDVDTYQVLRRIIGSMVPNPRANYLEHQIRPNPDMYGPFWICTTLVFTTAIAGNMANYFQHAGLNYEWTYDFHKVTFAASAIFSYWWLVPTILWLLLRWRNSPVAFSFLEIICVYGYSLAIYIPISVLWVIPYNWFQWLLVAIGMIMSGSVLVLTFWPAVQEDDKKVAWITMGAIVLFHGLLAVGFVLYFFHVPDMEASTVVTPTVGVDVAEGHHLSAAAAVTVAPGVVPGNLAHPNASHSGLLA